MQREDQPQADAYEKYLYVRETRRPRARDLIPKVFEEFVPYREGHPCDPNIIGGFAELEKQPVFVIGQNWRTTSDRTIQSTISAQGFALALEIMRLAEKYKRPLITLIDTPGGDPLQESAGLLQCWKISECIATMAGLKVPTISVIIGEGGSGGALSLFVADRSYMLENSVFSVISPEGCTQILFKGIEKQSRDERKKRQSEMASLLRPTARDMLEWKIIDGIIEEPEKGAHADHNATAKNIKNVLAKSLAELRKKPLEILLQERFDRFMSFGKWEEEPVEPRVPWIKRITGRLSDRVKSIFRRKKKQDSLSEADIVNDEKDKWDKDIFECKNPECGKKIPFKKFIKNFNVCPECGKPDRDFYPSADDWIRHLTDRGSFTEKDPNLVPADPLSFSYTVDDDFRSYKNDVHRDQDKTGVNEALIIGEAKIKGHDVVMAVSEYGFRGGSLSSVVGEKFVRAVKYANQKKCPLISIAMSGGARRQEGIFSLLQMAKTNMALTRIRVPYISLLADPTMAGSLSSYVTRGDIHLAETDAEIGFAGIRVVEGYIKKRIRDKEGHLPPWYYADFYLEKGGINEIVPREKMRERVHAYLELFAALTK